MHSITLSIKSDPKNAGMISAAIQGIGTFLELAKKDIDDIVRGCVETVNNCIEHAYNNRADQSISLVFSYYENQVTIEIIDNGDPMSEFPDFNLPGLESDNGRGWFIINACFDEISYNSDKGKNTIFLRKDTVQQK